MAVVGATAAVVFSSRLQHLVGIDRAPRAYESGDRIDVPRSSYDGAPHTMLLFARASCAACQNAAPLLSSLIAGLAERGIDVKVLAPATDRPRQVEYVRSLGLDEEALVPSNLRIMRVRVVPTAVLVNREGVILDVSEGGDGLQAFSTAVLARLGGR